MDIFEFDDDETCVKFCGEVFLTSKGNITICCALCQSVYKNYDSYASHLFDEHLSETSRVDDDVSQDETNIVSIDISTVNTEAEGSIEALDNEYQEEEQVSEDEVYMTTELNGNDNFTSIEISGTSPNNEYSEDKTYSNVRKYVKLSEASDGERRHKCPICNSAFKDKYILKNHIKRHSFEKQHSCPECGKRFHTNTEVTIHMQSHNAERCFLCSHCGRSYSRSSHLLTHLKRHTNQRNYKCDICDKAFYESTALKRHKMGHSTERPFACKFCPAKFSYKSTLRNHIKLHENKREYKCNLCEAGFNQKAGLLSHLKMSHKIT